MRCLTIFISQTRHIINRCSRSSTATRLPRGLLAMARHQMISSQELHIQASLPFCQTPEVLNMENPQQSPQDHLVPTSAPSIPKLLQVYQKPPSPVTSTSNSASPQESTKQNSQKSNSPPTTLPHQPSAPTPTSSAKSTPATPQRANPLGAASSTIHAALDLCTLGYKFTHMLISSIQTPCLPRTSSQQNATNIISPLPFFRQ